MITKLISTCILSLPIVALAVTPWDFSEDRPYSVAAMGDSISLGTNAKNLGQNVKYSWVTGTKIESHRLKILEIIPEATFSNFAINGAGIQTMLTTQLPKVLAMENLDYLTILIGANDLCHWNVDSYERSLLVFHQSLNQGLQRIYAKFPKATVFLLSPPNLVELKQYKNLTCQVIWNVTKICPSLLSSNVTFEQTQKFIEMSDKFNDLLEDMSRSPLYGDLRHTDVLYKTKFDKTERSNLDCFHPSIKGQKNISDSTFDQLKN
jgi:lysophospholipase L1-like esterase